MNEHDETIIRIEVDNTYRYVKKLMEELQLEGNFSQVTLDGIQAIQKAQRSLAPTRKNRSIPRSIRTARVVKLGDSSWRGTSETNNKLAIFTNEGTGLHARPPRVKDTAPKGKAYFIPIGWGGFWHPGIQGTKWWERGADIGGTIAFRKFHEKVEHMLRLRMG